jgi:hypothetical protein
MVHGRAPERPTITLCDQHHSGAPLPSGMSFPDEIEVDLETN